MKNRVVFDFFDVSKTMYAFCEYFKLDKSRVECFIQQEIKRNEKNFYTNNMCFDFVKEFNLSVDKIESTNVFITAKHLTTLPDKGLALQKYGLLNLYEVLEKDTPLKRFLRDKGIEFDIAKKQIKIQEKNLDLFYCNGDCKSCSISKKDCDQFSTEYKKAIRHIYIKLYLDKSETEVFLCGKDDELEKYSCVSRHPEFLRNIDKLLAELKLSPNLSKEWTSLNDGQYYILEFDIGIRFLEYIPDYIYAEKPSYDMYENFFNLVGYTENQFISGGVPDNFYHNVFLVENSLEVIIIGKGKEYGQILPTAEIPTNELRVVQKSITQH